MNNANLQLNGFLGADAKPITKNERTFTILRIATTDSYQIKDGNATKWVDKETVWHDVFVFNPTACKYANELKASDKVTISCSISYKDFKDENGRSKREIIVVGNFIQKIDYQKQESLFTKQIVDEVVESMVT